MRKFKPGDIVQLKSGGPKMTVQRYEKFSLYNEATCQWFVNSVEYRTASFPETSLKAIDTENDGDYPPLTPTLEARGELRSVAYKKLRCK